MRGFILFETGWLSPKPGLQILGAGLLALAIIWFSAMAAERLWRSEKSRDTLFWGLQAAILALNATWVLGGVMAVTRDEGLLSYHIATALAGWVGCLVMVVQLKLVPMFAMAKLDRVKSAVPPILLIAGLLSFYGLRSVPAGRELAPALWVAACLWALGHVGHAIRHRKTARLDPVLAACLAWMGWTLAAIFVWAGMGALAVVWGLGAAGLFIVGFQSLILPFMVALAVARRLPGPLFKPYFLAQSLWPRHDLLILALGWLAGLLGFTVGVAGGVERAVIGASFIMVGRFRGPPAVAGFFGGSGDDGGASGSFSSPDALTS